jgi:hypothetical protein
VTVNVTPEMIQRFEAERKARQEENNRKNNNITQFLNQQKAQADAYWAKKTMQKPHTAKRASHPCEVCKGTIHIGEQYRCRAVTVNVSRQGWTPKQRTVYRHVECPQKTEES